MYDGYMVMVSYKHGIRRFRKNFHFPLKVNSHIYTRYPEKCLVMGGYGFVSSLFCSIKSFTVIDVLACFIFSLKYELLRAPSVPLVFVTEMLFFRHIGVLIVQRLCAQTATNTTKNQKLQRNTKYYLLKLYQN